MLLFEHKQRSNTTDASQRYLADLKVFSSHMAFQVLGSLVANEALRSHSKAYGLET